MWKLKRVKESYNNWVKPLISHVGRPQSTCEVHDMSVEKSINFLETPSSRRLRREISNICDSYSHPWDILAELCQNSVDAIRLYGS